MLTIAEALALVMADASALAAESVGLPQAHGRVLAEDLVARLDSPPFDNSAMDGYALRSTDLVGASADAPKRLPVVGESSAGTREVPACGEGVTVRIFTGAPMPEGADCVVIQENVTRAGEHAHFARAAAVGQNVRRCGEDARRGDVLLRRGARLSPGEIGLLASQGIASLSVVRQPRVAVVSSGDELRRIDDPERPGSIVNSNAYMLEALLHSAGALPDVRPIAPDDLSALRVCLEDALRDNDAVITTGGVSVGDHDEMRAAFVEAGVHTSFWKVAIKPGKPFAFGRGPGGRPVMGLPGNPVSAFVTFEVLVRPLLRALAGDVLPYRSHFRARLASSVKQTEGREELLRARLRGPEADDPPNETGLFCVPVPRRGSGALPALAGVDVLARVPAGAGVLPAGSVVECVPLFDAPSRATSPFT